MAYIPFNRPCLVGKEFLYIQQAIDAMHISGDGSFTKRCQTTIEQALGVPKALLTTSCTHALEMAGFLLDIGPGDEVIVPAFTFVSTVNAFVVRGACPTFIDVQPDTLNLDPAHLERLITPRTKAIVPVHYAGVGCEMSSIIDIAARHNIPVVEDNAHGLFGRFRDKYLGTFGCLATQSFHETKNFTCGEGGMLIISDERYIERAEIIREKGTDRGRFYRGQVDKYTWVDMGSSYLPSDILAAFLYAQLESREQVQASRRRIWDYYYEHLTEWAQARDVKLPVVPPYCEQSYHMFYLIMPSLRERQELMRHLEEQGINTVFHYTPLHLSKMGRYFGARPGECPVTEYVSDRLLRLPFFSALTEQDLERVVEAIIAFKG